MRKVIRLVGVQLWAVLADMLSIGKSRNKKPKVLYVSILLFILLMSAISFFYSFMIGSGLKKLPEPGAFAGPYDGSCLHHDPDDYGI